MVGPNAYGFARAIKGMVSIGHLFLIIARIPCEQSAWRCLRRRESTDLADGWPWQLGQDDGTSE